MFFCSTSVQTGCSTPLKISSYAVSVFSLFHSNFLSCISTFLGHEIGRWLGAGLVCHGEDIAELEVKALDLPVDLFSNIHLWS